MKQDIHPKYYDKATITCACGKVFTIGSVVEKMRTEICSNCHPFYTGKEKLIDTAGRVERFKARHAQKKEGLVKKSVKRAIHKAKKVKTTKAKVKKA
ncbi:MAG: 50S ribosomal protein L31 [Candidatus Colwellbacteria bacterium]|nr:50S ribosomal protein L31 [Candidatus Colwellbacteria bacterium]